MEKEYKSKKYENTNAKRSSIHLRPEGQSLLEQGDKKWK